jgi:hypothetical protein
MKREPHTRGGERYQRTDPIRRRNPTRAGNEMKTWPSVRRLQPVALEALAGSSDLAKLLVGQEPNTGVGMADSHCFGGRGDPSVAVGQFHSPLPAMWCTWCVARSATKNNDRLTMYLCRVISSVGSKKRGD